MSIVVATLGRAEKLHRTLSGIARLRPETPPFEVIVVLDGPDPASRAIAGTQTGFPVRILEQGRQGVGPAKNRGADCARAPYLLFLNDDTYPSPACILAHLKALEEYGPSVIVGRVDWDPDSEVTPYMAWLAPAGHQFNFSRLAPGSPIPWDACWGAHVGIPRAWHLEDPFDESFPFPSLEDVEWGFRLARRGHPIRFVPEARAYHDHYYGGPADYRKRARISGAATRYTVRRHPPLVWPLMLRPAAAAAALSLAALWPFRWRRETVWDLDFRWNYLAGVLSRQGEDRFRRGPRGA